VGLTIYMQKLVIDSSVNNVSEFPQSSKNRLSKLGFKEVFLILNIKQHFLVKMVKIKWKYVLFRIIDN
jgi:hypothetical protein